MSRPQGADGTVGKALGILEKIAEHERPVRFSDLMHETDMPKATLYRLMQTLTNQGMLQYDCDNRVYALGTRLVRLAHVAWRQSSIAPLARPYLDNLSAELGETLHLAQLEGGQVLYVDKRNSGKTIDMYSQAGKVGPAYCTGVGKAILAHLDPDTLDATLDLQSFKGHTPQTITDREQLIEELNETRERGFAFDREEHEPGIICVAAPILSAGLRPLGALSATSTTERTSLNEMTSWVGQLQRTASEIAQVVETWRFPDATTLPNDPRSTK